MATIVPTKVLVGNGDGSTFTMTWTPVTESDVCQAVSLPEYADKSVHASGTFGGASVRVYGSNNGSTFVALNDASSTAIAISAEGIKQVLENTLLVKPDCTGGSAQSLTITMLFRLSNPLRQ
jgi:hypothetical protein